LKPKLSGVRTFFWYKILVPSNLIYISLPDFILIPFSITSLAFCAMPEKLKIEIATIKTIIFLMMKGLF